MGRGEVAYARDRGKPVVPILLGSAQSPPALADFQSIHFGTRQDLDAVTDAVVARAKDAFFPDE